MQVVGDPTQGQTRGSQRPPFGQAVGFLLSQMGFVVAKRFHELMADVGLAPRHFALMRSIATQDGISQVDLCEQLEIPPSSMVSLVDYLQDLGLVERLAHPSDRRARVLRVTAKGDEVLQKATALAMGLETDICRGFEPAQRQELITSLQHVADNLGLRRGVHPDIAKAHDQKSWVEEVEEVQ